MKRNCVYFRPKPHFDYSCSHHQIQRFLIQTSFAAMYKNNHLFEISLHTLIFFLWTIISALRPLSINIFFTSNIEYPITLKTDQCMYIISYFYLSHSEVHVGLPWDHTEHQQKTRSLLTSGPLILSKTFIEKISFRPFEKLP